MRKRLLINLLLVVLLSISISTFSQTNLYVSSSGNNNGTANTCIDPLNPCRTFDHTQTQAINNYAATTNIIINFSIGGYTTLTVSRSNITLRGAQASTIPNSTNRKDRAAESRFELSPSAGNINSITIANSVSNVTIEGFEFRSNRNSSTVPLIALGGSNFDIVLQRNSIVGNSIYSGGNNYNLVQPFLLSTGILTNIQIVENRFYGYKATTNTPVISILSVESGAIRSNYFGSDVLNATIPQFIGDNDLENAIILGNVKNFAIAQNQFQGMNLSAIELQSTLNIGVANNDAIVRIDSNKFERVNQSTVTAPTTAPTEPTTLGAGILLRANNFTGDSVLIRYNEFLNDNKFAIAIPNANNAFTSNSIKIFANNFSINDLGNSQADIYVGSDATISTGKIDVNANWWGKTAGPYTPSSTTAAGGTADIFGSTVAITMAKPVVWLKSAADANAGYAFIPTNKVIRSNGIDGDLQTVFAAVPENWELELADGNYNNIPTIVRSFTLNPLDAATNGESFPGLILNGNNYNGSAPIMTLRKNIQIDNGANVTFTKGKIQLGAHDLRVLGSSGLPEGDEDSYIVTDGLGRLIQTDIGNGGAKTGSVIFPIGPNNTFYTPLTLNNTGAKYDYLVSVIEGISVNGNDGDPVKENAVNLTWGIDIFNETGLPIEENPPIVALTLQWNTSDPVATPSVPKNEWPGFDYTTCYIAHYTNGKWENLEAPPGTPATLGSISGSLKKTASGIKRFSPFTIGSPGAALPVRLVDFKAQLKNNDVALSWITASEKDNDYFSVERSEDGTTFSEIGKVNGTGTTDISNSYEFTDVFATETGRDVLYYRLRQVDTDGKFAYSKIQDVVLQTRALRLFPNPTDKFLNIALPGKAQVQVISSQGQIVMQKEFESLTQLNVSNLAKGVYIFKLTNGNDILLRKVSIF